MGFLKNTHTYVLFSRFHVIVLALFVVLVLIIPTISHATVQISVDTHKHDHIRIDQIDTIIHSKEFAPLDHKNNAINKTNPWIKISWDKNKITDKKYLINDYTSQSYENYYLIKNNEVVAHYASGYTDPFDIRPIKHFKFVADISHIDYVLAKTCCNPGIPIYFRLLNAEELNTDYYHNLIWYAVVYALILMMVLYNFFIFFYLKEKQYLYYCYYLLSMLFVLLTLSGIGKQFIWPNITNTGFVYFFSGVNASVSSMVFLTAFLDQNKLSKISLNLVKFTIWLHILVLFSYFLDPYIDGMYRISNGLVQLISIFAWLVNDYIIIRHMFAKDRSALVLLISYSLINISGLIFVARYNGLIPNITWTAYIVEIAVLIEALILSLALAQKIRKLREDKMIAENKQLHIQQQFSQQLLSVQEDEKRRLGTALHDNFTHQLLIVKNNLSKQLGKTHEATKQLEKILNDIRNLSHLIHPYLLEKLGLKDAVTEMIERMSTTYPLELHFACDDLMLNKQQELLLYRIIQESINNIIKHAHASEAVIAIMHKKTHIELLIKDDGKGFDLQKAEGLGLITMRERCIMLSGEFNIVSTKAGTEIKILFPHIPHK